MARTARANLDGAQSDLTAEDQRLMDEMRADDDAPDAAPAPNVSRETSAPEPEGDGTETSAEEGAPEAPKQRRMVPLDALHEERERRKGLEQQMRTLEERTNILLQRMELLSRLSLHLTQPPPPIPHLNADPVGHLIGSIEQLRQQNAALQGQTQATIQQQAQAQAIQNLQAHLTVQEARFRAENPDYNDAITFLREQADKELEAQGYTDPVQRQHMMTINALQTADFAMRNGRDPVAMYYNMAKGRGFAAKPAEAGNGTAANGAGERLERVAAGQQQARGLSGARGSGPAPLTAQRLLELSDSEFSKMIETPEGKALLG